MLPDPFGSLRITSDSLRSLPFGFLLQMSPGQSLGDEGVVLQTMERDDASKGKSKKDKAKK